MIKLNKRDSNSELTQAMTLILLSLIKGGKHGYGVMTEIASMTNGEYRVSPGTLYRSIDQMLKRNLIEEAPELFNPEYDDERRNYYKITAEGKQALAYEIKRMDNLVRNAQLFGVSGTLSKGEI